MSSSNPILEALAQMQGGQVPLGALANNALQSQQAGQQQEQLASQLGEQNAIIERQKQAGLLGAEQETQAAKSALGANPGDANYLVGDLSAMFRDNVRAAMQQKAVVDDLNNASFLDSPAKWLTAQFTINDEINKYNSFAENANFAEQTIDGINNSVSAAAQQAAATAKVVTGATAEAAVRVQAIKDQMMAGQLRQQNLRFDTDSIQALQQGRAQQVSEHYQQLHYSLAVTNSNRQAEEHAANMVERKLSRELHEAQLEVYKETKLKAAEDEAVHSQIMSTGAQSLGLPVPPNKTTWKFLESNPDTKAAMDTVFKAGVNKLYKGVNASAGTGEVISAMKALGSADSWNGTPVAPLVAHAAGLYQQVVSSEAASAIKKLDERNAYINDEVTKRAGAAAASWNVDAEATPYYRSPGIAEIMHVNPKLAELPIFSKVIEPLALASKTNDLSADQIAGALRAAMGRKEISFSSAATQLAMWFTAAKNTNNATKQFATVGYLPQVEYNVRRSAGLFSTPLTFDISTPEQAAKFLQYQTLDADVQKHFSETPAILW